MSNDKTLQLLSPKQIGFMDGRLVAICYNNNEEANACELVQRWNAFEGLLEASRKALADLEEWKKWSESLEFIDMSDAGHIEYPSLVIMEELVAAIAAYEKEG